MKRTRRHFFLLLFIAATLAAALHELSPLHEAETCPVCIVDQHSVSASVVTPVPLLCPVLRDAPYFHRETLYAFSRPRLRNSRDPPFFL